jgi:hypothetical protein
MIDITEGIQPRIPTILGDPNPGYQKTKTNGDMIMRRRRAEQKEEKATFGR